MSCLFQKMVTIIIPVLNEEKYIQDCLESVLSQDYPRNNIECLCIDGDSDDRTIKIIESYRAQHQQLFYLLYNPQRTQANAMNVGIAHAHGDYIVRMDAHAVYPSNYISRCVYYLDSFGYSNVGGAAITEGRGKYGKAIAKVLSSPFGVGNSRFRIGSASGETDTVPFGAFRKEVFEKWGGFDTRLVRNEDNEINYRIRKNGGIVFLANDIQFTYYCRDTIQGLAKMAFSNGMWNIITMKLCPGSMGVRHFIPLLFVLSILTLIALSFFHMFFAILLLLELLCYGVLDAYYSFSRSGNISAGVLQCLLFPVFHICYGIGSLRGIIRVLSGQYLKEK